MGHKYLMKKEDLYDTVNELREKVTELEEVVSTVNAKKKRTQRTQIKTPPVKAEAVTMQIEEIFPEI